MAPSVDAGADSRPASAAGVPSARGRVGAGARADGVIAERRWDVCVVCLRRVDADEPLALEDLKLLGLSLYMTGADDASAEVLERAHRLAVAEERWPEAAETAFWYAFMLVNSGEPARGGAWLARSRATAGDHAVEGPSAAFPDVVEARGLLELGRVNEGMALAASAARVGRLGGDANLEVLGRLVVGWALLRQGRREDALRSFDEVMLNGLGRRPVSDGRGARLLRGHRRLHERARRPARPGVDRRAL